MQPLRSRYIFVIVNVPDPVHPPVPVKFHVPVIVLRSTVPRRVSVLPLDALQRSAGLSLGGGKVGSR